MLLSKYLQAYLWRIYATECPLFCPVKLAAPLVLNAYIEQFSAIYVDCPTNFVPKVMRQTGMRGAFYGTRKEAHAGAECELVAAD
jgi:hypothetical protein